MFAWGWAAIPLSCPPRCASPPSAAALCVCARGQPLGHVPLGHVPLCPCPPVPEGSSCPPVPMSPCAMSRSHSAGELRPPTPVSRSQHPCRPAVACLACPSKARGKWHSVRRCLSERAQGRAPCRGGVCRAVTPPCDTRVAPGTAGLAQPGPGMR